MTSWLKEGDSSQNNLQEESLEILRDVRTIQRYFSYLYSNYEFHCPTFVTMFVDFLNNLAALKEGSDDVIKQTIDKMV